MDLDLRVLDFFFRNVDAGLVPLRSRVPLFIKSFMLFMAFILVPFALTDFF